MEIDQLRVYERMSPFEIKDTLISLAKDREKASAQAMLNAGRGNPNWIAPLPREGFFLLGQFAVAESRLVMDMGNVSGMPAKDGCAERLRAWLDARRGQPGEAFLRAAIAYAIDKLRFEPDAFVHELTDSIIGDNYPVPDRILEHNQIVTRAYLDWAMCGGNPPPGEFDLYAVEGGTAAMCYVFKSLFANRLLRKGDAIALVTPTFTPYLEMPHLEDYALEIVELQVRQEDKFQITDQHLATLADPRIKACFLVNPGNPTSASLDQRSMAGIAKLVREKRQDLIVLTDDVYGTFVDGFRSLMAEIPRNTIGVYSYSKYFGCTGWRLGVIALHQDNALDDMLKRLPQADLEALHKRYTPITLDVPGLKLIDRIVADSRDVALNHTAGLSLPQQVQMTLFGLAQLIDREDSYRQKVKGIVWRRFRALVEGLGIESKPPEEIFSAYYGIIDFEFWITKYLGRDVATWITKNYHPLDIVFRLAEDHGIVLLNGGGFGAPNWSARVSFANLTDDVYDDIGRAVRAVARSYVEAYRFAHQPVTAG
jgi:aspartate 4-decarboxylase